jgi:hypothetical protein
MLARRLRNTNSALAASRFLSVKGRVARALLSLADAFGKDVGSGRILIWQKVTQSDLAAMAGIARENVSRVDGEPACRLLLPGEEGRHQMRSRRNGRKGAFRALCVMGAVAKNKAKC